MKEWALGFLKKHGERLVFACAAFIIACVLYYFTEMKGEAKTIIIGVAMLFFNKSRGTDQSGELPTYTIEPGGVSDER